MSHDDEARVGGWILAPESAEVVDLVGVVHDASPR
jgi:hypothetical protein